MADDKSPQKEIIDWDEAMEQCGDDEDFLRELLDDLRIELKAQMTKIEAAMVSIASYLANFRIFSPLINPFFCYNSSIQNPVHLLNIRSAAHVIKGSAGNLMCEELQWASRELEMLAKNHPKDESVSEVLVKLLRSKHDNLKIAAKKFQDYVDAIKAS